MPKKIGNRLIGENAEEQFKLEKKRFKSRLIRKEQLIEEKRNELIKIGKGNRKLSEFFKNDEK